MAETDPTDALFYAVSFTIIPGDEITPAQENELISILTQCGAEFSPLRDDGRVDDFTSLSHIISEHVDFPDYYTALDQNTAVVKPSWVFQSYQKKRQAQTRQYSPDPALFFRDVILSCGNIPDGDKDAIIAGVLAMGGHYSSPLTKLVTHVVAFSIDDEKCRVVDEKKLSTKLVLPHWFDDCLQLGKCISEEPYTLPNPEILKSSPPPDLRAQNYPDLRGATSAVAGKPPNYIPPSSPSQSRKELVVFKGKKILFSKDLNINDHLAETLRQLVKQAGGSMTKSVDECDTYIGHYRDGTDYVTASRANKEVANLAWFYNVINRNRWINPLSKLLHYPIPRSGIPGFKDMRISLSNYSGESRLYLENLIKLSGAEFTKTMKQDNTHLITAHKYSEKCEAAQEWNINILNHLWLEESYARCVEQALTSQRYICFPPRTNLTEVVGMTPIDLDAVRNIYFPDEDSGAELPDGTTTHPFRGAVNPEKVIPASSAAMPSTVPQQARTSRATPPDAMDVVQEEDEEEAQASTRPRATAKRGRGGRAPSTRTPTAPRQQDEKENETPPTTGRASKQAALENIHKQKDDIELFQREMKRKGGVIHGGRKGSPEPEAAKKGLRGRKRTSGDLEEDEDESSSEEEAVQATKPGARATKRAKGARDVSEEPVKYHMIVSGDDRWVNNAKREAADAAKLRKLGIVVTTTPSECTLLCAPRILRTRKFVAALACAPEVVTIEFLDEALKTGTLPDTEDHELNDRVAEERLGFTLDDTLARAEENKRKLLHGWTIYLTDKIPGSYDTFEEIIKVNGGTATPYRGRTGLQLPRRKRGPAAEFETDSESQNGDGDDEADTVYLLSGTEDEEIRLWAKFRTLAEKQGLKARICKSDWVLNLAMGQRIEWDDKWELREDLVPGWQPRYSR